MEEENLVMFAGFLILIFIFGVVFYVRTILPTN